MDVFFFQVDKKRLPNTPLPELPQAGRAQAQPWLWLVHPAGRPSTFIQEHAEAQACLDGGGAILFLSGEPSFGLTPATVSQIEKTYGDRVHLLRVAFGKHLEKQIQSFVTAVKPLGPWEAIPWSVVEPAPWPETLVSAYLLLRAIDLGEERAEKIRDAWNQMDDEWKGAFWKSAWADFQVRIGDETSAWTDAGLPDTATGQCDLPRSDQIEDALDCLREALPDGVA